MNWLWYAVVIILIEEAIDFYISWRQLRRYRNDTHVPLELTKIINQEDFLASCKYNGDKMIFGLIRGMVDLPISLLMMIMFLYPYIWNKVGAYFGTDSEVVQSLAFLGALTLWEQLYSLPWDLYSDFAIEEKHGFNKKTLGLFFMDTVKMLLLVIVFGIPITIVTIHVVRWAGPNCYLWLWGFFVVLSLAMTYIIPWFIMPLFNKYEPLKDLQLKEKVEVLARRVGFPLNKLYQMDGSKRTTHTNAFMYGFWNNKCIVLYDTLLELEHDEIVAVLGHELGHWKKSHTLKLMSASFAQMLLYLYLFKLVVFNSQPFQDFGFHDTQAVIIGIYIFSRIITPLNEILEKIMICVSRIHELQADAYAKELGYGTSLRTALIKIGVQSKVAFNPDPWYAWMTYTHPTLTERLAALKDQKQD